MRYVNESTNPSYCSEAGCTLKPGAQTSEIGFLKEALKRAKEGSRSWGIRLSREEESLMLELMNLSRKRPETPVKAMGSAPKPRDGMPLDTSTARAMARDAATKALADTTRERNERINSESVYIGPDGRPVSSAPEGAVAAMAAKVEPKVVRDPMSALEILSHNAAVTKIRAEEALTGRAAVDARHPVVGMPRLPGTDSMKPEGDSMDARHGPNAVSSDDILNHAEENNYGRR